MKKPIIGGLAGLLMASVIASATHALPISVVPSESVVARHTPRPQICGVLIGYLHPSEVYLYCDSRASAWVKFRVPGVVGEVTRVTYSWRGRCSAVSGTWGTQRDAVVLKLVGRGLFDCYVTGITVRVSPIQKRQIR